MDAGAGADGKRRKKGAFCSAKKACSSRGRRYSDFPLYSAPTSFLDTLPPQIPVLLLMKFFSPPVVGLFALATKAIGTPLALVGSSVGKVYYQWISEAAREDLDLRSYVLQVAKYLFLLVSGPVTLVHLVLTRVVQICFRESMGSKTGMRAHSRLSPGDKVHRRPPIAHYARIGQHQAWLRVEDDILLQHGNSPVRGGPFSGKDVSVHLRCPRDGSLWFLFLPDSEGVDRPAAARERLYGFGWGFLVRTIMEYPRIGVITPSYNQGAFIRETIDSVLGQDYPNIEYRVIDGGSTDDTPSVLKSYGSRVEWVSEPDHGQASAINKGLKGISADIVAFINSDDVYLPHSFSSVAAYFAAHLDAVWLTGDHFVIDSRGKRIQS